MPELMVKGSAGPQPVYRQPALDGALMGAVRPPSERTTFSLGNNARAMEMTLDPSKGTVNVRLGVEKKLEIVEVTTDIRLDAAKNGKFIDPGIQYLMRDSGDHSQYKGLRTGETVMLGRDEEVKGRFDMPKTVSRRHAEISLDADGRLSIRDNGSVNGTQVDYPTSAEAKLPTMLTKEMGEKRLMTADLSKGTVTIQLAQKKLEVVEATQAVRMDFTKETGSLLGPDVLYLVRDPVDHKQFKGLREGENVILGRDEGRHGRFEMPPEVSRLHVALSLNGGKLTILDLESENGTRVETPI